MFIVQLVCEMLEKLFNIMNKNNDCVNDGASGKNFTLTIDGLTHSEESSHILGNKRLNLTSQNPPHPGFDLKLPVKERIAIWDNLFEQASLRPKSSPSSTKVFKWCTFAESSNTFEISKRKTDETFQSPKFTSSMSDHIIQSEQKQPTCNYPFISPFSRPLNVINGNSSPDVAAGRNRLVESVNFDFIDNGGDSKRTKYSRDCKFSQISYSLLERDELRDSDDDDFQQNKKQTGKQKSSKITGRKATVNNAKSKISKTGPARNRNKNAAIAPLKFYSGESENHRTISENANRSALLNSDKNDSKWLTTRRNADVEVGRLVNKPPVLGTPPNDNDQVIDDVIFITSSKHPSAKLLADNDEPLDNSVKDDYAACPVCGRKFHVDMHLQRHVNACLDKV